MKKLISSLSLMVVAIIFCSFQATAQYHRGNGNHNGNWGNNGNGYGNSCGNNGYNNNNNNCNNNNNHCGNNGYRKHQHSHSGGYSMSFGYTYSVPCAPGGVIVYRPTQCAPRPHCRRW